MRNICFLPLLAACSLLNTAQANSLTALYQFRGGLDGASPSGGLIRLKNGSLMGTTSFGGTSDKGTVFLIAPPNKPGGAWTKSTIWSFSGSFDGEQPQGGLQQDSRGNVYGTTERGGSSGAGVLFRITPPASMNVAWSESPIWQFGGTGDGRTPSSTIVVTSAGTIFGTTASGGRLNEGAIYEVFGSSVEGGPSTESLLWNFTGGLDGNYPTSVLQDRSGRLYGVASEGGYFGYGDIFELTLPLKGVAPVSQPTILWSFNGVTDGAYPTTLVTDRFGTFYGTLVVGQAQNSSGSVFKLSRLAGHWHVANLIDFPGGEGGSGPSSLQVVHGQELLGTTISGGVSACSYGHVSSPCGVAYTLNQSIPMNSHWIQKIMFDFSLPPEPSGVSGPLSLGNPSVYYGETMSGGAYNAGTVFTISE